jgi:uncharacterized protein (DUF2147 family)
MVRKLSLSAVLALAASSACASAESGATPLGDWARGDGNAKITIAPCGPNLCATNIWIRDPSRGEEVGDKLVLMVQPESDTVLDGEAFDQKRQRTYSVKISVGDAFMKTRGCVFIGLLCKTVTWTRIQ